MTGPEHYQAAELMIEQAQDPAEPQDIPALLAEAQVHATLALAAATALNDGGAGMSPADYGDWFTTASVVAPAEDKS